MKTELKVLRVFLVFGLLFLPLFVGCQKNSPSEPIVLIATMTSTPTVTASPSNTPGWTATNTPTPTNTQTAWVLIATNTDTPTASPTDTDTPVYSPTGTSTLTVTQTAWILIATNTFTKTVTPSATLTITYSATSTVTPTYTYTCAFTFSFTQTATNTSTNTSTPTVTPTEPLKLNLTIRDGGGDACSGTDFTLAYRIDNNSNREVSLDSLKIKFWLNNNSAYSYSCYSFPGGNVYPGGAYFSDVPAGVDDSIPFPACIDTDSRKANTTITISFSGTGLNIPSGGYAVSVVPGMQFTREWQAPFDDGCDDYSKNIGSVFTDDIHYALYKDDVLMEEWLDEYTPDSETGREPCDGLYPSVTITHTDTPTITETITPTVTPTNTLIVYNLEQESALSDLTSPYDLALHDMGDVLFVADYDRVYGFDTEYLSQVRSFTTVVAPPVRGVAYYNNAGTERVYYTYGNYYSTEDFFGVVECTGLCGTGANGLGVDGDYMFNAYIANDFGLWYGDLVGACSVSQVPITINSYQDVAVSSSGDFFLVNGTGRELRKYNSNPSYLGNYNSFSGDVYSVAVDIYDNIYVTVDGSGVWMFDSSLNFYGVVAAHADMTDMRGIAVDGDLNIYVSINSLHKIMKFVRQ